MSISHYQDPEVQRLATEVRNELRRLGDRIKALQTDVAYLERLGEWVRDDQYPVVVDVANATATPTPPAPPEP